MFLASPNYKRSCPTLHARGAGSQLLLPTARQACSSWSTSLSSARLSSLICTKTPHRPPLSSSSSSSRSSSSKTASRCLHLLLILQQQQQQQLAIRRPLSLSGLRFLPRPRPPPLPVPLLFTKSTTCRQPQQHARRAMRFILTAKRFCRTHVAGRMQARGT